MNELTKHVLIILFVAGAVFFTNLGNSRLWDRDEPRNAGCAQEMMERGDWVVPIFNDELRAQKPVLLYWLMMSAYTLFGVNEFSARFWSAALALGSVMGTYVIARRLFEPWVALLAAIILSTTVMFDVAARAATPDSVLIFCGTMALMIYVLSVFRAKENLDRESARLDATDGRWFPIQWPAIIGIYLFLGLGALAKGPIGFLLPMAIIGMFMLLMRAPATKLNPESPRVLRWLSEVWNVVNPVHFCRTVWAMNPLMAITIILLIAAPWYAMVGVRTEGDFLQKFFLKENFARATTAMENHSGGLWYYPATMMAGFFPWSIFAVPVALYCWKTLRSSSTDTGHAGRLFLVCWVAVQVGLFSLASTKLPSYVTPCYPALAILTAMALRSFATRQTLVSPAWFRVAAAVLIFSGVMAVIGMLFVAQKYLGGDYWIGILGLIPLVGGAVALGFMIRNANSNAVISVATSAVLFAWGLFGFGTVAVDQHRDMANVLDKMTTADTEVATYGVLESSWVFYAKRRLFELAMDDNPKHPTSIQRTKNWKPKPWVTPEVFANTEQGLILTTNEQSSALLQRLPHYEIVSESPYFLNDETLVLVAPKRRGHEKEAALPTSDDSVNR